MRQETMTRARQMALAALRIRRGRYADAVVLLARRCRPSQTHTLARALLLAAGSADSERRAGRKPDVQALAAVSLAAAGRER